MINRSESQLIARDQSNQVRKSSSKRRPVNLKRSQAQERKKAS